LIVPLSTHLAPPGADARETSPRLLSAAVSDRCTLWHIGLFI